MNWEVIRNERSSLQEFRLSDHNDCKVVIKYNPRHQSVRLTCGNHHRLFYLESAGSLSGKTIFRNEYGTEIGNLVHDKFHPKDGAVIIDSNKYLYHLQNDVAKELVIFNSLDPTPIACCSFQSNSISSLSNNQPTIFNNCYLLGTCWYLMLQIENDRTLRYSTAFN